MKRQKQLTPKELDKRLTKFEQKCRKEDEKQFAKELEKELSGLY